MLLFLFSGTEIQKKWKALRDAYLRSLRTQTAKSGSGASKRRPYPYQQQMAFLQPTMANRQTSGNMDEIVEEESNALQAEEGDLAEQTIRPVFRKPTRKPKANFETQLIDILKGQQNQTPEPTPAPSDDDENKLFLLSLLPKMRKLSPNASFDFRIKVMQCLQECYTNSNILDNSGQNMPRTEPQQHPTTSLTFMNQYDSQRCTFSPGPRNSTSPASETTSTSTIIQPWEDTDDSVITIFNLN